MQDASHLAGPRPESRQRALDEANGPRRALPPDAIDRPSAVGGKRDPGGLSGVAHGDSPATTCRRDLGAYSMWSLYHRRRDAGPELFLPDKESITAQYALVDADCVESIANSPSSQTRTVAKMRLLVFAHENLLGAWDTPGRGCEAARVSTSPQRPGTKSPCHTPSRRDRAARASSSERVLAVTVRCHDGFPLTAQAHSESGPSSAAHHDGRRSTFHLPKSPIMLGAGASTSTAIGSKRDGPCRLPYTRLVPEEHISVEAVPTAIDSLRRDGTVLV